MKPAAACLAALLWFVRHPAAVARSRSAPVHLDSHHASSLQALHASDEARQLRGGVRGKEDKAEKKSPQKEPAKPESDNDTLTHELVDQATTTPSRKNFDAVDQNGDDKIDLHEYLASTSAGQKIATYRFNCSDLNLDSSIDFEEFKAAQAKGKDMDRCISMLLAFQLVDKNQNGEISQDELWSKVGGPTFDSRWAFLMACSDLNGDGKVSPMEFSTDMYGCSEDKAAEASDKFSNFTETDTDGDGCANETEMAVAINMLFGVDLISTKPPKHQVVELTRRWMSCVDFDSDQCLSKKEYADGLLNPTPEEAHCIGKNYEKYEADMDFLMMDKNDDGKISQQEYYTWCSKVDIEIDQQEADDLFKSADVDENGFIDANEFKSAGDHHNGDGPGNLFFLRFTDPWSLKSRNTWLGSIQKTWAGFFKRSAQA